jgi:hypothetical protein
MGLSWISPLYLSGILLLALPVLIHLVQKQSRSGIKFPSLMFLKKIPYREKRRLKIRNWWLLILRCLLLLLIVIAFARPFFASGIENAILDLERKDSVIVIDKSYSMQISDHWQQAQEIALGLLDQKNALDRVAVVIFDDKAEVLSDLTTDVDSLRGLIKRHKPGLRTTQLRAAIEQAARLLNASDANQKQILLISDFQASAASSGGVPRIAQDITLTTFAVKPGDAANTTISSFSIKPPSLETRDEYALNLELTNHSSEAVDQQIKLQLNGRELHRRNLRLEPGSVVEQGFDGLSLSGDLIRGVVSLSDDALALDNRAFFVYSSKQAIPVLILEGSRPRVNQSFYLESALGLSRNPVFRVKRLSSSELKAEELSTWAVIIINDAPIPGGALGEALLKFVTAGGGLIVATGDAVQGNWPSGDEGFLPGTLFSKVVSKQGMAQNMTELEGNHPLSNMLDEQGNSGLSLARIFSYRNLRPNAGDRVIGRYDNGAVALLERSVGQGRVLVLTTTLDTQWNDLAVQPIFLPFLHHVLRYLAAFESHPSGFEVGSVVDVMRYARAIAGSDAIVAAADDSELIVELPSAKEVRLNRQSPLLAIEEQGFYQIHRATPSAVEVVLAANINPAEANLMTLDLRRFEEEIMNSAVPLSPGVALTQRQAGEREQQQQIWYVILSAVLVLMLIEAFSANWISRQRSIKT